MKKKYDYLGAGTALLILTSCAPSLKTSSGLGGITTVGEQFASISGVGGGNTGLAMLSWIGGLSVLGGMVLLVITSGRKGWYPLLGGIILVLLNWLILTYAHALFLPVIVGTGVISVLWTYKIAKQILSNKKGKQKCSQLSLLSWARRGSSPS